MDLSVLFSPKIDLHRLAEVLEGLGHEGRVHTVRTWDREKMAALFEAAQGFHAVTLDDFVPSGTEPLGNVTHFGKNSLPAFTTVEKHFCKPAPREGTEAPAELWGFNNVLLRLVGPGFFTVRASETAGEVVFDYTAIPSGKAAAWPDPVPQQGIGRIVYGGLKDHVRGVSPHVFISRGERNGKPMDAWFALVRQDPS